MKYKKKVDLLQKKQMTVDNRSLSRKLIKKEKQLDKKR